MTFKQLSFDDWLQNQPQTLPQHRRGRKADVAYRQSIEAQIIGVMRLRANGRVCVSSNWIAIQLLVEHGIDRTGRMIRYHLKRMEQAGLVVAEGNRGGYRLHQNLIYFQPASKSPVM